MFPIFSLHPASRLVCWVMLVIAAQCLSGPALALVLLAMTAFGGATRRRWLQLLRRTRWLLLSLLVILGWSVAGEPLWNVPGLPSPSIEGLADGVTQFGRLSLVLALVAALMAAMPANQLMAGGLALLAPLRRFGLDVDRAVVRLALVLHYVEHSSAGGWRALLATAYPLGPSVVDLSLARARIADWGAAWLVAGVLVIVCSV